MGSHMDHRSIHLLMCDGSHDVTPALTVDQWDLGLRLAWWLRIRVEGLKEGIILGHYLLGFISQLACIILDPGWIAVIGQVLESLANEAPWIAGKCHV